MLFGRTVMSTSDRRAHNRVRLALAVIAVLFTGLMTAPAAAGATVPPAGGAAVGAAGKLSATAASARAEATGKAVVATALTTPTSQTTANADGSFTLSQSVAPTRLERDEVWVGLDPTLHTNSDGSISPNATTADVTLSGGGGSGPLATMRGSGHQVSLTMPFSLPVPTLSGNTAIYANVLPSVDLVVTVDPQGGVSDVLVVKTAAAGPASIRSTADPSPS
jgi:hypothetical protein